MMTLAEQMNVVRTLLALDRREVKLQLGTLLEILSPLADAYSADAHEMSPAQIVELHAFAAWLERLAPHGDELSSEMLREYADHFRVSPEREVAAMWSSSSSWNSSLP